MLSFEQRVSFSSRTVLIPVTYFQRKRRSDANFSIEAIFDRVRTELSGRIRAKVAISPFLSNGVVRRAVNVAVARFQQSDVNHVTGDTNFLTLGLDRDCTILTNHDCGFMARVTGWKREVLRKVWLQWPVDNCRFVTTVSEESKRDLLQYVKCDPEKIRVIHNAISPMFTPLPLREQDGVFRILQIGAAVNKNIDRLAGALTDMPVELCIVGKPSVATLQALEKYRIRYKIMTNLSNAGMLQLYAESDVIAFASTIEGFGLPILEAQAIGRPVVTSNISSMPEVAGEGACFVDPWNVDSIRAGVSRVIGDQSYRDRLIRHGFENVKRFDGAKIALQYFDLYRQIAG